MTECLRAYTVLSKVLSSVTTSTLGGTQSPTTLVLRIQHFLWLPRALYSHEPTHIHIHIINIYIFKRIFLDNRFRSNNWPLKHLWNIRTYVEFLRYTWLNSILETRNLRNKLKFGWYSRLNYWISCTVFSDVFCSLTFSQMYVMYSQNLLSLLPLITL